ncbi:MAG: PEP-CTERM sorting domain-containing protein, partial [Phycisphaerae bacterium]|nr:PEP-CTERM sorting domain-containing protein [Phycisphaerae bacterium]
TCNYTHNRTGHSYSFTGTYDQVVSTFYNACRDNMTWFKSTRNIVGMHSIEDNSDAGWNGTTLALMLMRAMFVDYKLSQNPITVYAPNASGTNSILFDQHLSYDPDCVSWNADATYDKVRGIQPQGIQFFWYDLDNDGDLDVQSFNNTMTVSADTLINTYGAERGQWNYYRVRAKDNEGVVTYKTGKFYLNPLGTPEPASLSLLAVGALAFLRRKR